TPNPIASSTTSFIQPQHQLISIKLTDTNYLLWKQQTYSAIIGYGLENFIAADSHPPERFISTDGTTPPTLNPAYATWLRQDQLLLSWLLSSLSENLLIMMVGKNTSKDVWLSLEANFSGLSKARLMHHKLQLQTLKKGPSSMREFLGKVKACCDALGIAGEPVSDQNHILYILAGLGSEYNPAVVAVTSRVEPYSLNEVYAMLLSLESRLDIGAQSIVNPDGSLPSVNLSSTNPTAQKISPPFPTINTQRGSYSQRGRGRSNNYRGRGGRGYRNNNNNRPSCQLCGLNNHTAERCFHRYDSTYPAPTTMQAQTAQTHTLHQPLNSVPSHLNALVTSPDSSQDSLWFADSGASNHVTNELSNLNIASEYQGHNRLHVGNGSGLSISHIGNFKFSTPSHPTRQFLLKNLLHVPHITKNLLS
ncbi:Unknown protein, partial [Striga hermonthica]